MSRARKSNTRIATPRNRPAKPARNYLDLFLGEEHWVAAAIPSADQMMILAHRDRAELARMVACWQNRPVAR